MSNPELVFPVKLVSELLDGILHGKDESYDELYKLADDTDNSNQQHLLLQRLSALVMKTEVSEYRLESMISDLLQTQARLTQAGLDPLTDLPNRAVFNELLHQYFDNAAAQNHSLGLMFVDLDKFKQVNDTLGHAAGDEILKQAANRMQTTLREEDRLARLGGDEFTILLPEIATYQAAERIAERILESLNNPFMLQAGIGEIGCSIGLSLYPNDARDAPALLKNADVAMYSAKEAGRNQLVSYPRRHRS